MKLVDFALYAPHVFLYTFAAGCWLLAGRKILRLLAARVFAVRQRTSAGGEAAVVAHRSVRMGPAGRWAVWPVLEERPGRSTDVVYLARTVDGLGALAPCVVVEKRTWRFVRFEKRRWCSSDATARATLREFLEYRARLGDTPPDARSLLRDQLGICRPKLRREPHGPLLPNESFVQLVELHFDRLLAAFRLQRARFVGRALPVHVAALSAIVALPVLCTSAPVTVPLILSLAGGWCSQVRLPWPPTLGEAAHGVLLALRRSGRPFRPNRQ